jgi:hypothetical protein
MKKVLEQLFVVYAQGARRKHGQIVRWLPTLPIIQLVRIRARLRVDYRRSIGLEPTLALRAEQKQFPLAEF